MRSRRLLPISIVLALAGVVLLASSQRPGLAGPDAAQAAGPVAPAVDAVAIPSGAITEGAHEPSAAALAANAIPVHLLAFNDYHGYNEAVGGGNGRVSTPAGNVDAGGAEYFATHLAALKAKYTNSAIVAAGDLVGASPLSSGLFHDTPTIEALNAMALEFSSVGNHEFDEGAKELLRKQNGGCHPVDGCAGGPSFPGASFKYLAANVIDKSTSKPFLPAYGIKQFGTVKVAFVGLVLHGTPEIVTPTGVAGLTFKDEAQTVNALVPELKAQGVNTIVVLIHEGGFPTGGYNECPGISGPIVDIVKAMDPLVSVVISGHTHQAYICNIAGKLVTSALSYTRIITDIDLELDAATGATVSASANNVIVTRDVAKNPAMTTLVTKYQGLVAPIANKVVGSITADLINKGNAAGEIPLGDVIADAYLAATAPANPGGAVIAMTNPGGIRADLPFAQAASEGDGKVTFNKLYNTTPFANTLVTMTLTGTQLKLLLEQQWLNQPSPRVLQVSKGFSYTWDGSKPDGQRVDMASIKINGTAITATGSYRVTVNNFMAAGGDGYKVLVDGTDRLGGPQDIDALVAYFGASSPVKPGPQDRVKAVNVAAATPSATAPTATSAPATAPAGSGQAPAPATATQPAPAPPSTGTGAAADDSVGEASLVFGSAAILVAGLLAAWILFQPKGTKAE